jgi:hypothetical protein
MDEPNPSPRPAGNIAGAVAMVIIGLVIFIPSGLCTGIIGGGALIAMFVNSRNSDSIFLLIMPLAVGGPFVAGGFALIWYGVKRLRGRR